MKMQKKVKECPNLMSSLNNIRRVKLVHHLGDGQIECVPVCVGRDMFTNSAHMAERE
jgi:hypothetical protein